MPAISICPNCRKQVTIPAGVDSAAEVRCPLCAAEYALGEALALAPPELVPVVSAGSKEPASAVPAAPPAMAAAEGETPHSPDVSEENDAAAAVGRLSTTSVIQGLQNRRSKSALRTVIEVILGGLAGCLVAYYALALWFGPEFNKYLPELPLPFISRLTASPATPGHATENPPPVKSVDR